MKKYWSLRAMLKEIYEIKPGMKEALGALLLKILEKMRGEKGSYDGF